MISRSQSLRRRPQVRADGAMRGAFLAHMSHELRARLDAVIGLSHLLARSRPGEGSIFSVTLTPDIVRA